MGMDYRYAGSSSYQRFDEELSKLAGLFGGIETEKLKERKDTIKGIDKYFGYSSGSDIKEKYLFPPETNPLIVRWFNNIYEEYTPEETEEIIKEFIKYWEEAEQISHQIISEFCSLYENEEGWNIG